MEWSVNFECPETERKNCMMLLKEAMPQWFKSLRAVLKK
jgi:hypothetical protein